MEKEWGAGFWGKQSLKPGGIYG